MERFVYAARADELAKAKGKLARLAGLTVALFNADGAFYAVEGRCPLDGGSLADGFLSGSVVVCAGDNVAFYLPTGESLSEGEARGLRTFRVRLDNNEIFVDVDSELGFDDELDAATGFSPEPADGFFG